MGQAVNYTRIEPFGVEVDMDLSGPVSAETYGALRDLFNEHHLLVFRRQNMDLMEQVNFAKRFGPVVPVDNLNFGILVSNVRADGKFGLKDVNTELRFHHDSPFSPIPDMGILFYALDVVDEASSTTFSSGAVAYDRLPESTRSRLGGLQTLNVFPQNSLIRNRNDQVPAHFPRAIHKLVWRHKHTGRPFLFSCHLTTDCILGLKPEESEALLEEIWNIQFDDAAIYEHKWRNGDLVLVDNHVLQHGRPPVKSEENRTLRRVTLAEKSFADTFPEFDVRAILGTGDKGSASLAESYQPEARAG